MSCNVLTNKLQIFQCYVSRLLNHSIMIYRITETKNVKNKEFSFGKSYWDLKMPFSVLSEWVREWVIVV
jgi:hypothetical protein